MATSGHWPDIGGRVPGGFSTQATEVYQEGLRLPPVRIMDRSKLNRDVARHHSAERARGDRAAGRYHRQDHGLNVGTDRLTALLDRYGKETVFEAIAEMKARSERLMRSHIETIPDGTYAFTDHIDSDGIEWEPLAIHLEMTVKGSDVHLDFSREQPALPGATE